MKRQCWFHANFGCGCVLPGGSPHSHLLIEDALSRQKVLKVPLDTACKLLGELPMCLSRSRTEEAWSEPHK